MKSFYGRLLAGLILALSVSILLSPAVHAAGDAVFKVQKRYLYVQPGQSIYGIVKVLYPNQKKQWPNIIRKIVRTNPRAFINHNPRRIVVGERIRLPNMNIAIKPVKLTSVYKQPEAVGQVIKVRGRAFSISEKNKKHNLKVGSEVYVGDRLYTGKHAFIRLSMIDEAKIDLRCNSEIKIEDYRLLRAGNRSIIRLLKGSLNKITGSIGKMSKDVYKMKTPVATVGVRGTEYALRVLQAYGCDGSVDVNSNGLFVKVKKGAIDIKNKSGKHELTAGNAAHIKSKNDRPEAIDATKGIFEKADKESISYWWWLLGIVLIGVAI